LNFQNSWNLKGTFIFENFIHENSENFEKDKKKWRPLNMKHARKDRIPQKRDRAP
jgi:hypothetical protein